jgi:UDP-N-acetylglucosamine:LPS N-acetylglucosamine transferase
MTRKSKVTRVCLAASAGGHASELMKLQDCWAGRDCFFITTSHVLERQLGKFGRVYVVAESNRRQPLRIFRTLAGTLRIMIAERPDAVITTGAAVGCIAAILGKLSGARVAWVDSIANAERLSLSGRLIKPFADLVLTQWPEIAKQNRSVEYVGHIL